MTIASRRESPRAERVSEATDIHTRLLRLALGVEESRSYWERVDPAMPVAGRGLRAFEERWFGGKSLERVRFLVSNFVARYDAYPEALGVLRRWPSMQASERRVICHWHLQLSDPLYRRFTGRFLVERRASASAGAGASARVGANVDRHVVLRWVKNEFPDRWSEATCVQFASKLLSAASEAGLVSPRRDPRSLVLPKVPDVALGYLLHLLRGLRFAGTLTENAYLASVGLAGGALDQRLRALPGLSFRRMGRLIELEWEAPTLAAWAKETQ